MKKQLFVAFILCLFIVLSCDKKEAEDPHNQIPNKLVGSWLNETFREGEIPAQQFWWVFNKNDEFNGTFEWYWKVDYPVEYIFTVVGAAKGTFTVDNIFIFPLPNRFGSQLVDLMSNEFYESVMWYSPGDEFYELFEFYESVQFEVNGNTLVCGTDENGDGDFTDNDESLIFVRQN